MLPMLLTVDVGGTHIKLGLREGGSTRATARIDACSDRPLADRLTAIETALEELCARESRTVSDIDGMVWAVPFIVAPDLRTVSSTFGKFDDAIALDLPGWSRESMGLDMILENDARAAAIGEWKHGAGRGADDMVMITLGTGIGTAAICGGRPLRGPSGLAASLGGHTVTHAGGRSCPCGRRGCVEAQVGSAVLPVLAREHPAFPESGLARESVIDYRAVFALADAGDEVALALRDGAVDAWGVLAVNLVHSYDPARIVLGGGIMASAATILPALRAILQENPHPGGSTVALAAAELGDGAALAGSEWLWNEHIRRS